MREATGNMWDLINGPFAHVEAICILTNLEVHTDAQGLPVNVMGAGSAGEAKTRFPELPRTYGLYLSVQRDRRVRHGNTGNYYAVKIRDARAQMPAIVAFATKELIREPAQLPVIKAACLELMGLIERNGWKTVLLPRPGCGKYTGRLDWESQVKPICQASLDDRVVVIDFGRP